LLFEKRLGSIADSSAIKDLKKAQDVKEHSEAINHY
jgi:hypothetical protein